LGGVSIKRKIRAVFDTGGGAVGLILPGILRELPNVKARNLFAEPDPSLTNREPNPLLPKAQEKIKEEIINFGADIGFLFDPDGDRLVVLDERGEVIRGDAILWLLAHKLVHSGDAIVYDIRSSGALAEDLAAENIRCFKSRVGHSFIKEEMRMEKAALGGELSGHYYFKDFFYSESSLFAMIKILQIISASHKKVSEMMKPFFRYFHSGEINLLAKNKKEIISALEEKYKDADRDYFDGATFRYPEWWFNVRPSNTEDYLRLVLEASYIVLFDDKKDVLLSFIFSRGAKLV
jgi:phosphomannomutase